MSIYFFSQFHRTAIGPLAGVLMIEFQLSASGIGLIASTYFIVYASLQIVYGFAIDRIGSRRVVGYTAPIFLLSGFLFALSPNFEIIIVSRILIATGMAGVYVAGLKAMALTFKPRSHGKVVGLYTGWGYSASIIGMVIPSMLLDIGISWRETFLSIGFISIFCYGLFLFLSQGEKTTKICREKKSFDYKIFHDRYMLIICFTQAVAFGVFLGLVTWGPKYFFDSYEWSRSISGFMAALPALSIAIGGPLTGYIVDRSGRRFKTYTLSFSLTSIFLGILILSVIIENAILSVISLTLASLALSGFIIWPVLLIKDKGEGDLARVLSVGNTCSFTSAFIFPYMMGGILDQFVPTVVSGEGIYGTQAYMWIFFVCFVMITLSAFVLRIMRISKGE